MEFSRNYFGVWCFESSEYASRLRLNMSKDILFYAFFISGFILIYGIFDDILWSQFRATFFMYTEKGRSDMCKVSENIMKIGEEKGRAEGRAEGKLELLVSMIKEGVFTLEEVVKKYGFTEQEIKKAMRQ